MDADGQHPANLLPEMLQKWQQGSDVVYAVRKSRDDQSWLHITFTKLFYKLINWRSRVKIPANAGDFRLMDRQVVDALASMPERNRFMKGLYAWVGFNCTAIDYEPLPRADGQTQLWLSRCVVTRHHRTFGFFSSAVAYCQLFRTVSIHGRAWLRRIGGF